MRYINAHWTYIVYTLLLNTIFKLILYALCTVQYLAHL